MLWVRAEDGSCVNLALCRRVFIDALFTGRYGVYADNHLLKMTDTKEDAKKVLDNLVNRLARELRGRR